MEGLIHPFGLDHLLAMVAVGLWSVAALPLLRAWMGPAIFLLALVLSATLGMLGVTVPYLEHGVSMSVVLLGAMLVGLALGARPLPPALGFVLIAAASSLHGLAHGAETPETGYTGYAIGFLITTAALHLCGVGVGLAVQRWMKERRILVLGGVGTGLGVAGFYFLGQLAI